MIDLSSIDQKALSELLDAAEAYENSLKYSRLAHWKPYPKQQEFIQHQEPIITFFGGNRVGKSMTAGGLVSIHATGRYPEGWQGRKYSGDIHIWASGLTGQATRDIVQKELIGDIDDPGNGMIPRDAFIRKSDGSVKFTRLTGVTDAVDTIWVQRLDGGVTQISFKSNEQGRAKWQGTARQIIWLDEEHSLDVFKEAQMRTMTVHGQIIMTFTPLEGMTELCKFILDTKSASVWHTFITWEDCPHLTPEICAEMESTMLPHEIECRKNGIPSSGKGRIYQFAESGYVVDPVKIQKHWKALASLDPGFSGITAALMAYVDEDEDVIYIVKEYYITKGAVSQHSSELMKWGIGLRFQTDPAGVDQTDGTRVLHEYKKNGLDVHKANKAVNAGIMAVTEAFLDGRLKIFRSCEELIKELRLYRWAEDKDGIPTGKPLKKDDHCCDALRYLIIDISKAGFINLGKRRPIKGSGYRPVDATVGV